MTLIGTQRVGLIENVALKQGDIFPLHFLMKYLRRFHRQIRITD